QIGYSLRQLSDVPDRVCFDPLKYSFDLRCKGQSHPSITSIFQDKLPNPPARLSFGLYQAVRKTSLSIYVASASGAMTMPSSFCLSAPLIRPEAPPAVTSL